MASLELSLLKPEDVSKILQFSYILSDSIDQFENTVLSALEDIFGYSISTYSVYSENIDGDIYISSNFSNFFRKKELDYYDTLAYKDDPAVKEAVINRALNSSKYVYIFEYSEESDNQFVQTMLNYGIRYQIRVGANTKVEPPVHILSVYKTLQSGTIDEYELKLLETIGKVFSRYVGLYKQFHRMKKDAEMYDNALDDSNVGYTFYSPNSNILNYNMLFLRYAGSIEKNSRIRYFVDYLIDEHNKNVAGCQEQQPGTSVLEKGEYIITIYERQLSVKYENTAYYVIRIAKKGSNDPVHTTRIHSKKKYLEHDLTIREMEVCELIESGLNNTEIAEKLVISMPTVKTHIKNIFSKFDVCSRLELLKILHSG